MSKKYYPIWISEITGPEGKKIKKAVVDWSAVGVEDLNSKLNEFEKKYNELVTQCKKYLSQIKKSKDKKRARLESYWNIGDLLHNYIKETYENELFLSSIIDHLSRDLKESRTQLDYCRQFKLLYSEWGSVNSEISWSNFVELFPLPTELRRECEEKLVTGTIKNRDSLRKYIKQRKRELGLS